MTPTLHPIVVRFRDKKAAPAGFKKDYYIIAAIPEQYWAHLVNDKGILVYVRLAELEIVNAEDFSFNKEDIA